MLAEREAMASIKEGKKNGTVVPFYFTASFGKDAEGKQIRRFLLDVFHTDRVSSVGIGIEIIPQ